MLIRDTNILKRNAERTMQWYDSQPQEERRLICAGKIDNWDGPDLTWNRQHRQPKRSVTLTPIQLRRMGLMR